jgi:hypothetical protein
MWQTRTQPEANHRILKLTMHDGISPLSFAEVFALLRESADFRGYFTQQLAAVPFRAFRWETPGVTTATVTQPFECVVIDDPSLARRADASVFASYFTSHGVGIQFAS